MSLSVASTISPRAAAKLIISGEIDLLDDWSFETAKDVLDALLDLSIADFLSIVDTHQYGLIADIKNIPQFGKCDTIIQVPRLVVKAVKGSVDYPQLGFFLKQDITASLNANTKFGENHGKAASICGIIQCQDKRFIPSSLTEAFLSYDVKEQDELLTRLFFRVPIIQIILKEAGEGVFNGHAPMALLQESTRNRRSQSLRAIFRQMRRYPNDELLYRLDNITWEDLEVEHVEI